MIKQLTFEDYKKALEIIKSTMPEEVYNDAVYALSEVSDNRVLFGWFENDKLVGMSGYHSDNNKYWISWTAVLPDYQRRRIGSLLIDRVFQELSQKPVRYINVETYEHPCFFNAVKFYLKKGFRLVGFLDDYLQDGSKVLYLRKTIE